MKWLHKRRSLPLCLLGLLLIVTISSAGDLPRHQDPNEIEEEPPHASKLFLLYQLIFRSITVEDFAGAQDWLAWALRVYTPDDISFTLNGFNQLLGEEIEELNSTRFHINEASESLRQLREEKAQQALVQALLCLTKANVTLGELEDAAVQLASALHASSSPLQKGIEDVRALIEYYLMLIRKMQAEVLLMKLQRGEEVDDEELEELLGEEELEKLLEEVLEELLGEDATEEVLKGGNATVLHIEADRSEALIGTSVNISGSLTTVNGLGLQGRTVFLLFDGVRVEEAVTDVEGDFSRSVTVPYVYKDSGAITAVYWPKGTDVGVFAPSISNTVLLRLLYYTPVLAVECPRQVYPGLTLSVSGNLSFEREALPDFKIVVAGFGGLLQTVTDPDGRFSRNLSVPADTPIGNATVRVEAFAKGVYGPVRGEWNVEVARLSSELQVNAPPWIFSGSRVNVEGRVTVKGAPLNGCRVVLETGGRLVSTRSLEDGCFKASVDLPLAMFTARYTYSVTASPEEPWVEPSTASRDVFVFNVFTLVGAPVCFGVAVFYTFRRVDWSHVRKREEPVEGEVPQPEADLQSRVRSVRKLNSLKDFYWRAVKLISWITGRSLLPSQTIREYLEGVRDGLGKLRYSVFESLSRLYERWLYGAPVKPDLDAARNLLQRLREMLKR